MLVGKTGSCSFVLTAMRSVRSGSRLLGLIRDISLIYISRLERYRAIVLLAHLTKADV
jgi:hypothetical protein